MLEQLRKFSYRIMLVSYLLMISGLFLWDGFTILFFSIFTLGIPLILLAIPIVGVTMIRANSKAALFLRLFCALLSLIPLIITIKSLPLQTATSENGDYIMTPPGIAVLIITAGIIFLSTANYTFYERYQALGVPTDKYRD